MPTAPEMHAGRRFAALTSMGVGVAMLAGKWAAYWLTGSHAILSDALESIVHIAATAFALAGVLLTARPPDPKYPYGYGKVAYFSAGFEGGLIVLAALAIVYEAIQGLVSPHPLQRLDLGVGLIAIASVVNLALGWWLVRQGRASGSLILEADGHHVLTDSYTSFGVLVGVFLVRVTGWEWLDPTVAILVALNIVRTGYHLVREGVVGLMDRADEELLDRILAALEAARNPGWIDIHHLRAWRAGDRTFVDFHLVVPPDWTVVQLHAAHDAARDVLRGALGTMTEPIIHFDPGLPDRVSALDPDAPWTRERAVRIPVAGDLGAEPDETSVVSVETPVEGVRRA